MCVSFTEAVVGLERPLYTEVLESVGVVEVCTIVYSPSLPCPIDHPFNVRFLTDDDTAGIYNVWYYLHKYSYMWFARQVMYIPC